MKSMFASTTALALLSGVAAMRSTDDALLAGLGLGDAAPTEGAEASQEAPAEETVAADVATKPKRTEIKIVGEIKKARGLLPPKAIPTGFGGKTGSKYPFETLGAPEVADGTDPEVPAGTILGYDYFEVFLKDVENADAKKLQGAIQAATSTQNSDDDNKAKGVKYVSRTLVDDDGAYIGSAVYRTDGTDE